MVSAWTLMSLVPLIASNWYAMKQIEKLRAALEVRDIILGPDDFGGARIAPNGTLVQTFERPVRRIRVTSRYWAEIKVEYDHA